MKLHKSAENDVTLVQNRFIDNYMSAANGEFVKVYLYLLRCSSGDQELTLSSIADALNHTEKDVSRALSYWEKQHLLRLTRDLSGTPTDIIFTDGDAVIQGSRNRTLQYAAGLQGAPQDSAPERSLLTDAAAGASLSGKIPPEREAPRAETALQEGDMFREENAFQKEEILREENAFQKEEILREENAFQKEEILREENAFQKEEILREKDLLRTEKTFQKKPSVSEDGTRPADPPSGSDTPKTAGSTVPDQPVQIHISAQRRKELSSQEEIQQLLYIAEQYLARQLSSTDVNHILYFYDELHFSADLIEYLIEYCVSKGKKSIHYIRRVALGWAADGVKTVEEARRDSRLYHKEFYTILNAFGIQGRGPAQAEIDYMTRWYEELGFSTELILEACSRTITRIQTPSFPYTDSILQGWKDRGVRQVSDIEKLDPAPKPEASRKSRPRSGRVTGKAAANYGFKQRDYDFDKLEQQLLDC